MKPVVSAFNAWTWSETFPCQRVLPATSVLTVRSIVISVFAIVILSVLGTLFSKNNHSVMGATDDPEDGSAVAGAVFGAVGIYGVSLRMSYQPVHIADSSLCSCSWSSAAAKHSCTKERGGGEQSHSRRDLCSCPRNGTRKTGWQEIYRILLGLSNVDIIIATSTAHTASTTHIASTTHAASTIITPSRLRHRRLLSSLFAS